MLSTDQNPSCSSSSSKPSQPSDLVAASGSDHDPPPVFSIRDYVLKSRSKDVRINWPFREQLLNLCLDNGISELLPPLELPSLVRSYCYQRDLRSKNKSVALVSTQEKIQRKSVDESDINASSSVLTSHDLSEQLRRNFRSPGVENSVQEVLTSNSGAVSDPMASKVCPVCKSFTSTSNTTLNAHIDQCLSSDPSNATRDVSDEFPKVKVKPKKKRLMVDIYMTAPHSTLEDLDRRNGTNWAVTLAVVAPASTSDLISENRIIKLSSLDAASVDGVSLEPRRTKMTPPPDTVINDDDTNLEAKRTKLSTVDATNEGNVGDIYVDSNGTKLLILSRFDDSPSLVSRKKFMMKKHGKGFKSGMGCSINKKELLNQKRSEFMEDISRNKKLNAFKGFHHEIDAATEVYHISEDHQEREEARSQLSNADHVQIRSSEPSTLGHWVCSKRSDLSRKQANKDINRGSEKMIANHRKLSFRHTPPDSHRSSLQQRCVLNLPSFSEAVASPKTKCTNILSNNSRGMDSGKKRDLRSSNLNSKLLEYNYLVDDHVARMSCPTGTPPPSLKARRNLSSKKTAFPRRTRISLEGMRADKGQGLISHRKFKKHRSILSCTKGRGNDKHDKANGGSDSSSEDFCPVSSNANEASEIHDQSDLSADQEKGSLDMTDPVRSTVTAPGNDANFDPSIEEQVESLSRYETLVEAFVQRSIPHDERQCHGTVTNEVNIGDEFQTLGDHTEQISDYEEIQTETTALQEPSACLPSHGEIVLDTIRGNSLTNLVRAESNYEDHDMIVDMESSGSAVSTASGISPPSPVNDRIKDPTAERLAEHNSLQDKMSSPMLRKDNVKLAQPPREHSCCCSESLSRESQQLNHKKSAVSNLCIKPPPFSFFREPFSSLESHTESVLTMDSSKSATNASTPCSRPQSASNPILRLMGKDLVVGRDESTQMPTILPCDSQANFISFAPPTNVGFIGYHNPYTYPIQTFASHQVPFQPLQMRSDKFNTPSPWCMERMIPPQHHWPRSAVPSHPTREVIVIDDDNHGVEPEPRTRYPTLLPAVQNPNLMAPQRLFACFPPPNPYAPRAFVPSQREASEGAFLFPSPSSLYFSPTLR